MQREFTDVLLRFQRNPLALMCDIAEMYFRIEVTPKDQRYQRFLWKTLNQERAPVEYEFNRAVFGVNFSPFQAQFVAQTHPQKHKDEFRIATETVLKATYMDNRDLTIRQRRRQRQPEKSGSSGATSCWRSRQN